ncbi:hypothetical protein [Pedobacter alluvionis]|uniref:Uncharacterized protein n=1 Tax=Pedobacter alluvionis TaxID=475253 RepID=A0A497YDD5_9SPHI|nr:hypothetical protein [Pedobacter alluvionis]RLJ79519.1 hypothetical protein BCL90_0221 [Pedobacter alluvionis]TFB30869.1 hypothetical protein E3V97_09535 [Pedobacter alluvionis]
MKNFLLALLVAANLSACTSGQTQVDQNPDISADNLADEISKHIKHYQSEKIYMLGYSNDKCYVDLYVNGIKLSKAFNKALGNSAIEINPFLFQSGKCKVSFKMYPLGKSKEYDEVFKTFVDDTSLELNLLSYDLKDKNAADKEYITYTLPKKKEEVAKGYFREKFNGVGKTFFEDSFEFDIDLPYRSKPPFEGAMDLRKLNKSDLESKLLKKYQEVWNVYRNKEYDNIARLEYNSLKGLYVSTYENEENVSKNINTLFKQIYKNSSFEMQPLKKYKLEYFAGGKLAALMLDTNDNQLRGNTALWAKVNYDEGARAIFLNRYFYIPAGETEFKVY